MKHKPLNLQIIRNRVGAKHLDRRYWKAEQLSRAVKSGIVAVNNVVVSDPRVSFGGVKKSRFGRELSRYCMLEFANIKSIRFYDQLIHHHYVE